MSDALILPGNGEVTQFDPMQTRARLSQLAAVISHARRMKDWEMLEQASKKQVAEQTQFLVWWAVEVSEQESSTGGPRPIAERPSSRDRGTTVETVMQRAQRETGIKHQQVSRMRSKLGMQAFTGPDGEETYPREPDPAKLESYYEKIVGVGRKAAGWEPEDNHRALGTGEDEWHTPAVYIEAARSVMGSIELDPASNDIAQRTVQADRYYTKETNGLLQPWSGTVFLNPPYSQPTITDFVERLVHELADGNVTQAILLTNNYSDTAFFQLAAAVSSLVCFPRGRIRFIDPDGEECKNPAQGQTFFYFGPSGSVFARVFQSFGWIAETYRE